MHACTSRVFLYMHTCVVCLCVCTCDLCMRVHTFIISRFLYLFTYFWTSKLLASLGFYKTYSDKHGCVCSKRHGVTPPLIPASVCPRLAQLYHRAALILVFGGTSTLTSAVAAPVGVPPSVCCLPLSHTLARICSLKAAILTGVDGGGWGLFFLSPPPFACSAARIRVLKKIFKTHI